MPAVALLGGTAIPVATELAALETLAILAALLVALIVYESIRFAELRESLRHQVAHD